MLDGAAVEESVEEIWLEEIVDDTVVEKTVEEVVEEAVGETVELINEELDVGDGQAPSNHSNIA